MKRLNCIYAKTCNCNCGICTIFVSDKPKNRDRLIMQLVGDMKEAENYFLETKDDSKKFSILKIAEIELTTKEKIVFDFECSNNGI